MHFSPLYWVVGLLPLLGWGQTANGYLLADYYPQQPGDTVVYALQTTPTQQDSTCWYWREAATAQGVYLARHSADRQWLESRQADGLYLAADISLHAEATYLFDAPLRWLPASLTPGLGYADTASFQLFVDNRRAGKGTRILEVEVAGRTSTRTPLQNFHDCLQIQHRWHDYDAATGQVTGSGVAVSYYARGVGLVKHAVRYWPDGQQNDPPQAVTALAVQRIVQAIRGD